MKFDIEVACLGEDMKTTIGPATDVSPKKGVISEYNLVCLVLGGSAIATDKAAKDAVAKEAKKREKALEAKQAEEDKKAKLAKPEDLLSENEVLKARIAALEAQGKEKKEEEDLLK
jgi:hypothetical protein